MLQIFFITHSKSIFWISPKTRLPRNYKNFSGLIVELLTKFKVFANIEENGRNNRVLLMKCIKELDEFTDFNESLNVSFATDGFAINFTDIASRVVKFKSTKDTESNKLVQNASNTNTEVDSEQSKLKQTVGWDSKEVFARNDTEVVSKQSL